MWQAKEASENGKQNDESDTVGEKNTVPYYTRGACHGGLVPESINLI